MTIQVLFFGATAAITGTRMIPLELDRETSAGEIVERLTIGHPKLARPKLHFSINQEFVTAETIICDGDELAIFTAVSGG